MPNKTVLITGTSRGIGLHLAKRFLMEGFGVIGVSRDKSSISHRHFQEIHADLSKTKEIEMIANQLSGESITGLINNAGAHGPIGPFERLSIDDWIDTFNLNLFGAAQLSKICIPSIRSGAGFIIFMSGGGGAFPRANYSAYGVSKSAVIRLADTLALELYPEVLVYCIAPGPNRTHLLEETRQNGEVVLDDDIVDFDYPEKLCVFLANNRDARFSGKFIHVRDEYLTWTEPQLDGPSYTMRRIDPRTLSTVDLSQL